MATIINLFSMLVFACLVFAANSNFESKDELVFAHILFRHGDRNIINTYPTDPWKSEINWPEGYGQLTNLGRQQHYELGAYLRRRYLSLIVNNGSYHKDNIYVRSTDVDRTLMSVSHNLAGMFPPEDRQIWNHSLMWQAIPIHTIPENIDHVLAMKKPCPRYNQAYEEYEQSAEIQAILKSNQSLIQYLEMHAGEPIRKISQVKTIYQALWVENLKNFPLPSWTDKVFVPGGDMEKLAYFCFSMNTNTKLLARLTAGFLIREMFERFTKKINATLTPNRSLWIYSAHDSTISNVLNTLGLFQPHVPIYASCLFFELHKVNGSFHVEIYYKRIRGEDVVPLEPLSIPNCGKKCPLAKLYEIYQDIIPTEDFDTECRLPEIAEVAKNPSQNSSNKNLVSSSVWYIIGLVSLFFIN